jgi:hypothetical protein
VDPVDPDPDPQHWVQHLFLRADEDLMHCFIINPKFNFHQITPLAANLAEEFLFDETSDSLPYSNGEIPAFARTSDDPLEAVSFEKRRRGRPPRPSTVARPKKGPVVEGRRFKRCKAPDCPYCFTPDCGACKNCLNPALKSKCVQRKVFFYLLKKARSIICL